jgi:ABC-type tungstate transport system substrate-binding protein
MHLNSSIGKTAFAYIFGVCCIGIPLCIGATALAALMNSIPRTLTTAQAIRVAACAKCLKHFSKLSVMVMSSPFGKTPGQTACCGAIDCRFCKNPFP